MAGRKIGSSELIEFSIALLVGVLAVIGGLFVIGFLLVEPIRNAPGTEDAISIGKNLKLIPVAIIIVYKYLFTIFLFVFLLCSMFYRAPPLHCAGLGMRRKPG